MCCAKAWTKRRDGDCTLSVSVQCFCWLFLLFRNQCSSELMCQSIGKKSWLCLFFPQRKEKLNKSHGIPEQRRRPRNCTNLLLLYRLIRDSAIPLNHHYSACPLPWRIFALLLWEYLQSCTLCQRMMLLLYFSWYILLHFPGACDFRECSPKDVDH